MDANKLKLNSLKGLTKVPFPPHQEYFVWTYVLNSDIKNQKLEGDYGLVICFGAYPNKDKADERAKQIIELTEYDTIHVTRLCSFASLMSKFDKATVRMVMTDTKGKITEYEAQAERKMAEDEQKKEEINAAIAKEREEELDPDSFEYFRVQAVHAAFNLKSINFYEEQLTKAKEKYNERVKKAKEHYEKHPESETTFLSKLRAKLEPRDEMAVFDNIESLWKSKVQQDIVYLPPLAKVLDPLSVKEGGIFKSSSKEDKSPTKEDPTPLNDLPDQSEWSVYHKGKGKK